MAKRLNYEIGFTGDTSQLKAAIQGAVNSLNQLGSSSVGQLTPQLQQASNAAMQLSIHMQAAMNPTTKKFDLTLFNNSLSKSKMTLSEYAAQLKTLGPEGERAFLKTANAIMQAEMPTKRLKGAMGELWTVMKNTMRWQLSSSILHGFIGAVQTAYGYCQDLDKSLNDIRIVSGKSSTEMARFAQSANNAAKALHTTTNEYAKASLIYYQQGLNDKEIEERTNATIKMANVTGQDVQVVSDQMTAIWNNFADGSKTLEYYADAITALGAATASSTDEIATGLEKFAGVANQIGLSYEYATAALTTITAETRQSADVVGTALKTLFARIQGLKLGETLEDGTTYNKYSEALKTIGVDIADQNGALKDMDTILDEIGDKWNTLAKDTQTALAQTVAGVRQYTQFVSLMDNWDTFEINVGVASGSEGELNKQSDIYAEGWEASRKKVKAAAEDIYDSLFDSQAFADFNDSIAPILERIADVIDALGGLKGVFLLIGSIATSVFQKQMAQGLRNVASGMRDFLGLSQKAALQTKKDAASESAKIVSTTTDTALKREAESYQAIARIKEDIYKNDKLYSDAQKISLNAAEQLTEELREQAVLEEKKAQKAQIQYREAEGELLANAQTDVFPGEGENTRRKVELQKLGKEEGIDFSTSKKGVIDYTNALEKLKISLDSAVKKNAQLSNIRQEWSQISKQTNITSQDINKMGKKLQELGYIDTSKTEFEIKDIEDAMKKVTDASAETNKSIRNLTQGLKLVTVDPGQVDAYVRSLKELHAQGLISADALEALTAQTEHFESIARNPIPNPYDWSQGLIAVGNAAMNASMALQGFQNFKNIWSNEDLSNTEKMTQALMSLGMILPIFTTSIKGVVVATKTMVAAQKSASASTVLLTGSQKAGGVAGLFLAGVNKIVAATGWSAVAAMSALIGILAIVGVGIYALIKFTKSLQTAQTALEKAQSKADAAARSLKLAEDAYASVTEKAKAFKEEVSDYHAAVDQISNLTKGTREYEEAISAANEKTEALIEKYELYGNYTRSASGLILLDEDRLAEVQKEQDKNISNAKVNLTYAKLSNKYQSSQLEAVSLASGVAAKHHKDADQREREARNAGLAQTGTAIAATSMAGYGAAGAASGTVVGLPAGAVIAIGTTLANIGVGIGGLIESNKKANEARNSTIELNNKITKEYGDVATKMIQALSNSDLVELTDKDIDLEKLIKEKMPGIDASKVEEILGTPELRSSFQELAEEAAKVKIALADFSRELISEQNKQNSELMKKFEDMGRDPDTMEARTGYTELYNLAYAGAAKGTNFSNTGAWSNIPGKEVMVWNEENDSASYQTYKDSSYEERIQFMSDWANENIPQHWEYSGLWNTDPKDDAYEKRQIAERYFKEILNQDIDFAKISDVENSHEVEIEGTKYNVGDMIKAIFESEQQKIIYDQMINSSGGEKDLESLETVGHSAREFGQQYGVDFEEMILQAMADPEKKINLSSYIEGLDPEEMTELMAMDKGSLEEAFGGYDNLLNTFGQEAAQNFTKNFKESLEKSQITNLAEALFKGQGNTSKQFNDMFKGNREAAERAASALVRYANAVETCKKNLTKWKQVAEQSHGVLAKGTDEYNSAKTALAGFLHVADEDINFNIDTNTLNNLEAAIKGDEQAYNSLVEKMAYGLPSLDIAEGEEDNVSRLFDSIMGEYWNLQHQFDQGLIGPETDFSVLESQLQAFVTATGMSVDDANKFLGSLKGVNAKAKIGEPVEVDSEQQYVKSIVTTPKYENGPDGVSHYMGSSSVITTDTVTLTSKVPTGNALEVEVDGMSPSGGDLDIQSILSDSGKNWSGPSRTGTIGDKPNSGGGSSGGSGSKKDQKKKPNYLVEKAEKPHTEKIESSSSATVDIFQDINRELDKMNRQLEKTGTLSERAWGLDRLALMKQELVELTNEEAKLIEKRDLAESTMKKRASSLIAKGAKLDAEGYIINAVELEQMRNSAIGAAESAVKRAQKQSEEFEKAKDAALGGQVELDDEGNILEKDIEKVNNFIKSQGGNITVTTKEEFENWVKDKNWQFEEDVIDAENAATLAEQEWAFLDDYTSAEDARSEAYEELMQNYIDQADKTFQIITEKFQQIYDFKELENTARDFFKTIEEMGGQTLRSTRKVLIYEVEQAKSIMNENEFLLEEYDQITAKIDGIISDRELYNSTFESEADYRQRQQEIIEQLISNGEDLMGFLEGYSSTLVDSISLVQEEMDKFTAGLEHNISLLQTFKEINTLVSRANGVGRVQTKAVEIDYLNKTFSAQHERTISLQNELNIFKRDMATAEEQMTKYAGNQESVVYKSWKQKFEAAAEAVRATEQEMYSSAQESLEMAAEIYLAEIDMYMTQMENTLTKGKGFEFFQTVYDNMISREERYLDTVNESYAITKLNNDLQKSIDEANSLSATTVLKNLKNEIALRRESGKLTQYDVDILKAKYEVTKAQIALEEAQNNKSSMRLARNAQGNWNYVFSANQDEIDKAQENYNSAVNDYYNLAKDKTKETADSLVALRQETANSLREILENDTLTQRQKQTQISELWSKTKSEINYLNEMMKTSTQDMSDAGSLAVEDFESSVDNMVRYAKIDLDDFKKSYDTAVEGAMTANTNFENNINTVEREAGLDLKSLADKAQTVADNTNKIAEASNNAAYQLNKDLNSINNSAIAYGELADQIERVVKGIRDFSKEEISETGKKLQAPEMLDLGRDFQKGVDYSAIITELILRDGLDVNDEKIQQALKERQKKIDWDDLSDAVISNEDLLKQISDVNGKNILKINGVSVLSNGNTIAGTLEETLDMLVKGFGLNPNKASLDNLTDTEWGAIVNNVLAGNDFYKSIAMSGQFSSWEQFLEKTMQQDITKDQIQDSVYNTYHINLDNINVQDGTELVDTVLNGLPMRAQQESSTNKW